MRRDEWGRIGAFGEMKTAGALARLPQWSGQSHLNSGMIDASPLTMEQSGIAYGLDALCKPLEKLDAIALRPVPNGHLSES
jgi:hypothetical protein